MSHDRLPSAESLLFDPLDRRGLLRGVGQTSLAAGLAAVGLGHLLPAAASAAHGAAFQEGTCLDLRVFAKRAADARVVEERGCGDCQCGDYTVFTVEHVLHAFLGGVECDETDQEFPGETLLELDLVRSLRLPPVCEGWVGSHRGSFRIGPGQEGLAEVWVEGDVYGTDGFDPEDERLVCCGTGRDDGVLVGQGRGPLDGCTLVASYRGRMDTDATEPCRTEQWERWEGALFGILACPCGGGGTCVGFEGLSLGTTYVVGDSFADAGVTVTVLEFQWGNGTMFSGGFSEVEDGGRAGGSGQELEVNNVNLAFDFGRPVSEVTVAFGEYGGNLNIDVNGDFQNFDDFPTIDGTTIGGVAVAVAIGPGGELGTLTLTGDVRSLSLGGQELWIDDVCFR